MTKLQAIVAISVAGTSNRLTNYTKFIEEVSEDEEGNLIYQQIVLKDF